MNPSCRVWASMVASLAAWAGVSASASGQAMLVRVNADLRAVSADGSVAYGHVLRQTRFVRWTAERGLETIGAPVGCTYLSCGTSSWDGRAVAITATVSSAQSQYRWTPSGGFALIGDLPGGSAVAEARACSGDGSLIVGSGRDAVGISATTWMLGGPLSSLRPAGTSLTCLGGGASYTGGIVVGSLGPTADIARPTLWSSNGSFEYLSSSSADTGVALACASDASVVVGQLRVRPFRWTRETGMVTLPSLPGTTSGGAWATSADGRVVVGYFGPGTAAVAFVWDQTNGMRSLRAILTEALGTDPGPLAEPFEISADGRTIVGRGYIARLPAWCAADVDDGSMTGARDGSVGIDDLLAFLGWFETGDVRADLDDGSAAGRPDAAVTIEDLLYFLGAFENGC